MFKKIHTNYSLRFRNWSRKSYAVFKSIGRQVTIGRLKNIVTDTLLGKQKSAIPVGISFFKNDAQLIADTSPEPLDDEEQMLLLVPVVRIETIYGGPVNINKDIFNYAWLKAFNHKAFSFFLFRKLTG